MIIADNCFLDSINAPVRRIKGRVELFEGSTLLNTFNARDNLKSFTIERTANKNKIFGYGICQKLTVKLRDNDRNISAAKGNRLEAVFGTNCDYIYSTPVFYINDISRNENTNELTLTAYDALYDAANYTFADLDVRAPYSIAEVATACATKLGLPWQTNVADGSFDTLYPEGANFDGSESVRAVLDAIAEATQTIYFIDHNWELTFKRLDVSGAPVLTINKAQYFSLKNQKPQVITSICHATELGDNVIAGDESGVVQYVRDNPFWELREDIADLLNKALAAINGLTITQFDCSWRGNYLLELGDKIAISTKDGSTITTYLLDDRLNYNGAMNEKSEWSYDENKNETAANPVSIGDKINQTYARVDKANQRIELVASEVDVNAEAISQIQINTDSINASVSETLESINGELETITKKVEASMTAEDVTIAIQTELNNGVDKVTTTTGFTFNEEGLTVSKSGSEMTTQITEDGMVVYRDSQAVLTADNTGVNAENLHATTYLIIGKNSRFEDYDDNRTGCFWIGG